MAYNNYTTRQVIALVNEYESYKTSFYDMLSDDYLKKGDVNGLPMSFDHWLINREYENIAKPDARAEGNAGRKKMNKLDRINSIDRLYYNIKGEAIKIAAYLPRTGRFKDNKGRSYSPTGQAYHMGARLPKENDLIIK